MTNKEEIKEIVFQVISGYVAKNIEIHTYQNLGDDLELLSDDQTFMALDLERKLRVKIPRDEWKKVFTVQDVVDILIRHLK